MIIAVVGNISSGKDLVSRYIQKKYHFKHVHMGNIVRELAEKRKIPLTRKNLRETQEMYHKKYGDDYVINLAMKKAGKYKKVVISGIRTPVQIKIPKKKGAKIILVQAKQELRFKRAKLRKRKNYSRTFKEMEKQENKFFNLKKTFSYADFIITNNGTKKQLLMKVDKIMKKIL